MSLINLHYSKTCIIGRCLQWMEETSRCAGHMRRVFCRGVRETKVAITWLRGVWTSQDLSSELQTIKHFWSFLTISKCLVREWSSYNVIYISYHQSMPSRRPWSWKASWSLQDANATPHSAHWLGLQVSPDYSWRSGIFNYIVPIMQHILAIVAMSEGM